KITIPPLITPRYEGLAMTSLHASKLGQGDHSLFYGTRNASIFADAALAQQDLGHGVKIGIAQRFAIRLRVTRINLGARQRAGRQHQRGFSFHKGNAPRVRPHCTPPQESCACWVWQIFRESLRYER